MIGTVILVISAVLVFLMIISEYLLFHFGTVNEVIDTKSKKIYLDKFVDADGEYYVKVLNNSFAVKEKDTEKFTIYSSKNTKLDVNSTNEIPSINIIENTVLIKPKENILSEILFRACIYPYVDRKVINYIINTNKTQVRY